MGSRSTGVVFAVVASSFGNGDIKTAWIADATFRSSRKLFVTFQPPETGFTLADTRLAINDVEFVRRRDALEELVLGLAEQKSLQELRPWILTVYPELVRDLDPAQFRHPNRMREAFHRWLRGELEEAVASDYVTMVGQGDRGLF